eukprot:1149658-Pelagomonas_calceolata.AAC.1
MQAAAPAAEAAQAMMAKLGVREDASQRGDIRALGETERSKLCRHQPRPTLLKGQHQGLR